jgi:hypothetical protein
MADAKWSWRHRIAWSNTLSQNEYFRLLGFCQQNFGSSRQDRLFRWDVSFVLRRTNPKHYIPIYLYTRVKLHFKQQEDLVMFKLLWSPED